MNRLFLLTIVLSLFAINSCKEDIKEPLTKDSTPPGALKSIEIKSIPGGADISYIVPADKDFLYSEAVYTLSNGEKVNTRSSYYSNSIQVVGFGDTKEYEIKLYAVDRSGNHSAPVVVKITPEVPPVKSVYETIEMVPAFGGVQYTWTNANNAPLAFILLAKDSLGKFYTEQTVYSGITEGHYSIRGFKPKENTFGIVIRDRWDNFSDTLKMDLTPMFEIELDKSKFNKIILDNDANLDAWEGKYERMYDGIVGGTNSMMHTYAGTGWPQVFTIDLGVEAKLSRFIVYQRQNFPYTHGNFRIFEIYGRADEPPTDGRWDGWIKLRDCLAIKPSQQGGDADEDAKHLKEGDEFAFTLDAPTVRYVRFKILETWGVTGFIHCSEITFFGQSM